MKYLLIVLLLTACGGGGGGATPGKTELTYMWYGDSRCVFNEYIEHRDCIAGRGLTDTSQLNFDYEIIIIHMGFNDMRRFKTSPEDFGIKLSHLIKGAEYKTWCVLPSWFNYHIVEPIVSAYRQEMINRCVHTVDPNIDPYDADKTHYNDVNYQQAYDILTDILESAQ